jgi:polyisoprenoid-binding protein YceI
MKPILSAAEVKELMESANPPVLLHVLPPEHFERCRLRGARNHCVYETAFLDQVREAGLDPAALIVVYGEGEPSLDSEVAASRLREAGFSNVADFRGGLQAWRRAGHRTEGSGATAEPEINGRFHVDPDKSVVRWTGRNLFNHHEGTVRLASGGLTVDNGRLTGGDFVIDMRSIACTDLTDSAYNQMLLRHLAHDDFFATDVHPTAHFVVEQARPVDGASEGTPNYLVAGAFTLRGVTRPLQFSAVIAAADADHLTGQALLQLDRTQFGSLYGSGRFFAFLGKHVVNDHIDLHLKVHASRAA